MEHFGIRKRDLGQEAVAVPVRQFHFVSAAEHPDGAVGGSIGVVMQDIRIVNKDIRCVRKATDVRSGPRSRHEQLLET